MKTKFPKLTYEKKNKMIYSEFKKNPDNKKNILKSISSINKKIKSLKEKENDLHWDLKIYEDLLYLTLLKEAEKVGFKEKAKVIFKKDKTVHEIGGSYLDRENGSLELCVNLSPLPKISYFNKKEFPIKLSHIELVK